MMSTIAVLDLRDESIRTMDAIAEAIEDGNEQVRIFHPQLSIGFVVIHEYQERWLRFDLVERGEKTEAEAKKLRISTCKGVPIEVVDRWDGIVCPGCRAVHDDHEVVD